MGLNEFQISGDFVHLIAFIILIRQIYIKQSCAGISGKSQLLLATVFTFRYLDLPLRFISWYNTTLKILFLVLAWYIVYLIFVKFHNTYDGKNDSFWNILIILSVLTLTFFVNYYTLYSQSYINVTDMYQFFLRDPLELAWTFSIYLEALAIIPQFHMIRNSGDGQNVLLYILALTMYRGLYICNWIYKYLDVNRVDLISSCSGAVQTSILIMLLIYIKICKDRRPKWQQIIQVFTVEAVRHDDPKKVLAPSFSIDVPKEEDKKQLLP